MATFLAYTYTGSTPDNTLLNAANNNTLNTSAQIQSQIDRLLATTKAREHFGEFAAQWLRVDRVLSRPKNEALFPGFTSNIRRAMTQETREIFKHVMFDGDLSVDELFGDFTFLNRDLANYYGIAGSFNNTFQKANTTTRGGILTSGAFTANFAGVNEASPIQRGVAIRELLMCQDVPPMPNDLVTERAEAEAAFEAFKNDLGREPTNREMTHFLTKDAPCSDCHETIINPHGFGMEDFDAAGLIRSQDNNGLTIDANGELIGLSSFTDGNSVAFTGSKELSNQLKGLAAVQSCFVEKSFRFVMGTGSTVFDHKNPDLVTMTDDEKAGYACSVQKMKNAMSTAGQNPRAAFRELGASDIVRYRK
jgi:hypothetical protein